MTEQLAFEKVLGNGGTVDCQQAFLTPIAVIVDGTRNKLLAASAFTGNQDGGVTHRDATNHFENSLHRLGLAHDIVTVLFDREGRLGRGSGAEFCSRFQCSINNDLHREGK